MIHISAAQMGVLEAASRTNYVTSVLQNDSPLMSRSLNSKLRTEFAGIVAEKLRYYGLRTAFAQRGFIRLAAVFGTRFDEDPLICEPMHILDNRDNSCVLRIVELRDWALDLRNSVYGPKYEYYLAAIDRIGDISFERLLQLDTPSKLLGFCNTLFPTRSEWLTPVREQALFRLCRSHLDRIAPRTSDDVPLLAATYGCALFLGVTCLDDPLHDFIRTIIDSGSASRAHELVHYLIKRARVEIQSLKSSGVSYVPG